MKLSFCSIAYRNQKILLKEIILKIKECGYDAIEIWGPHLTKLFSLEDAKQTLKAEGFDVSIISPYFVFTGDAKDWKRSIMKAELFIKYAYELDAIGLRCFAGREGSKDATSVQWRDCVQGIRTVADMAQLKNIKIFIETHLGTLADTVESTIRIVNDIKKENVGVICDIYNLYEVEEDNLYSSFVTLYPYIDHIHLKNANTSKKMKSPFSTVHFKEGEAGSISYLDDGDIDYPLFLNYIKKNKFGGYLSVEWFGDGIDEAALHEFNYLKSFFG